MSNLFAPKYFEDDENNVIQWFTYQSSDHSLVPLMKFIWYFFTKNPVMGVATHHGWRILIPDMKGAFVFQVLGHNCDQEKLKIRFERTEWLTTIEPNGRAKHREMSVSPEEAIGLEKLISEYVANISRKWNADDTSNSVSFEIDLIDLKCTHDHNNITTGMATAHFNPIWSEMQVFNKIAG